ncbi:hypothetical protein [Azospirillum sp. INR13]|nr:hypothetical protein [Azospirillum sp. INR13]
MFDLESWIPAFAGMTVDSGMAVAGSVGRIRRLTNLSIRDSVPPSRR